MRYALQHSCIRHMVLPTWGKPGQYPTRDLDSASQRQFRLSFVLGTFWPMFKFTFLPWLLPMMHELDVTICIYLTDKQPA